MGPLFVWIGQMALALRESANQVFRFLAVLLVLLLGAQITAALAISREAAAIVTVLGLVASTIGFLALVRHPLDLGIPTVLESLPRLRTGYKLIDAFLAPVDEAVRGVGRVGNVLLRYFVVGVAADLLIGAYLALVPVKNDPMLLLFLVLVTVAHAAVVALGWSGGLGRAVRLALLGLFFLISVLFFMPSTAKGADRIEAAGVAIAEAVENVFDRNDTSKTGGSFSPPTADLLLELPKGATTGEPIVVNLDTERRWLRLKDPKVGVRCEVTPEGGFDVEGIDGKFLPVEKGESWNSTGLVPFRNMSFRIKGRVKGQVATFTLYR